jgi:hypothetical protein
MYATIASFLFHQTIFAACVNTLPRPMLTIICHPILHAMEYRYFGLKTVQMKRCVRSAVHAAITATKLTATNAVLQERDDIQMLAPSSVKAADVPTPFFAARKAS